MGQKVCPRFDPNNPGAYYDQMNQFRNQGYQTYDPTQGGAWGSMQGQGQNTGAGWGQSQAQMSNPAMGGMAPDNGWGQPQNPMATGAGMNPGAGWGQEQTPNAGWGQPQNPANTGAGWGQAPNQNQVSQGQSNGWGQTQNPVNTGAGWSQAPAPGTGTPGMGAPTQMNQNSGFSNKPRNFGSGVVLRKGQKMNLSPDNSIHEVDIGLGWDAVQGYDLDASAFMLGANGKVPGDDWFVFYGQTSSPDGAVTHSGDSNGIGDGDDEIIHINLDRVSPQVQKIVFIVTIDSALERGYNFQNVRNAYMRVLNKKNNAELMRFSLSEYYSNVTQMVVGELYRHNGTWKVNPVGDGVAADLAGLCARYGVNVAG